MNIHHLITELDLFNNLMQQLKSSSHCTVIDLDEYSFIIQNNTASNDNSVDYLICGLTHGNEVIGLQIINILIEKFLKQKTSFTKVAVSLNNVEAYLLNKRYCDQDLNRSFLHSKNENNNYEIRRAKEIEILVKKINPSVIIDLHQTIEPTHSSFFVIPESLNLVSWCCYLNKEWPIFCFDAHGFSSEGRTLLEFAMSQNILCLVIEVSQNGFNLTKSLEIVSVLENKLLQYRFNDIHLSSEKHKKEYYLIKQTLTKPVDSNSSFKMSKKYINLDQVQKGECIAANNDGDRIISLQQGLILFPKTDERIDQHQDVGLIAQLVIDND